MAAIIAAIGVLLGKAWKLDNSAKLFTLTFLLVTFGSSDLDSGQGKAFRCLSPFTSKSLPTLYMRERASTFSAAACTSQQCASSGLPSRKHNALSARMAPDLGLCAGALVLTITRITGICSGVILTEILAVLVFPRSSTSEALTHLRTALKRLTELNAMAWQHGPLLGGAPGMQQAQEASAAADDSGTSPKSTGCVQWQGGACCCKHLCTVAMLGDWQGIQAFAIYVGCRCC